jgi:hypothetical protein
MDNHADIRADIPAAQDRREALFLMEPLLIGETSRHRGKLVDTCVDSGEPAHSVAARISSETGFSLDAGLVPRKRDPA